MTAEFARNSHQKHSSIPTSHDSFVPVSPACTMSILFERTWHTRINTGDGAGCSGSSPDAQRRFEWTDPLADAMPVDSVSDKWLKPVAGSPFGKTLEFARSVASIVPTVAIATLPLVLEMPFEGARE